MSFLNKPLHYIARRLQRIFARIIVDEDGNGTLTVNDTTLVWSGGNLYIASASNPEIRIYEAADATGSDYFSMRAPAATEADIFLVNSSGSALIDIYGLPSDGTSNATVRFGLSTNTTGQVGYNFMRGNGTNTIDHQLIGGSSGVVASLARNGGITDAGDTLAITDGVTAPATLTGHAQLYVDTADGDLKVKFADGTVKTIVTDT